MGLHRPPSIKIAGADVSPYVVGLVRGTLVLPAGLRNDELVAVLWHELAQSVAHCFHGSRARV